MNSDAIAQILQDRIDRDGQGVGIAVGVSSPAGCYLVNHGLADGGNGRPMASETILEIGSVTKVFTSILLAEMAERSELELDEPLENFLPPSVELPSRAGRKITLIDLATHTSGWPRMPANFPTDESPDPYGDYSLAQLHAAVSSTALTHDIGSHFEYSNFGFSVLGQALARRANSDLDALLAERVTGPLQMRRTSMRPMAGFESSTALGHNKQFEEVPAWHMGASGGAGGLRSTVRDLLRFLEAHLNADRSSLGRALRAVRVPRRSNGQPAGQVALGWHVLQSEGELFWHDGGTAGFQSFIGFDEPSGTGVVVLANAYSAMGVTDIGLHLLRPSRPLAKPPRNRISHPLVAAESAAVVGRYELAPEFIIAIFEEGGRLFTQATRQGRAEIYSEGSYRYFLRVVDAQLSFELGADGRARQLVLHQGGHDQVAMRLRDAAPS